jgi:hypothetical protein
MKNKMVVIGFFLVGCGGGGGGGGGGTHFSTSVSGSAPVASLSGGQQAQLCGDIQHFASSLTGDLCRAEAFLAAALLEATNSSASNADLQSACNAAYSDCVNASADAGTGQCDFSTINPATCTATVAQVSACLNDLGAQTDRAVAAFPSCSSVTAQSITSAGSSATQDAGAGQPASCVTLNNVCPGAVTTMLGTN